MMRNNFPQCGEIGCQLVAKKMPFPGGFDVFPFALVLALAATFCRK